MKDLYKIRHMTDFAHERPWLFGEYPELLSEMARRYLTVSGKPKASVQKEIIGLLGSVPKGRMLKDAFGALRAFKG